MDKKIKELINELNLGGRKVWYIPVRSKQTIENYRNTVLDRRTFDGNVLNVSYWGVRLGDKNEKNFESMSVEDFVCFITRDNEGYEVIDSIGVLSAKYVDLTIGETNWNDADFELIVEFESVFVLENKLRLTFKREKLSNILPNVPNEIFHNGYEMFRQWILNERLTRTKLGPKLIEEEELIRIIKNHCGGTYLKVKKDVSSVIKENKNRLEVAKVDLNTLVEDLFDKLNQKETCLPNSVSVITRKQEEGDGKKSLSEKSNESDKGVDLLSKKNQKLLGLMGEEYIFNLLNKSNAELFAELGIKNPDDVLNVEWDNNGYKEDTADYIDKSLGHDIRVITKSKTFKLEIKTSFNNVGYYSISRNELKEMAIYADDYYVVKVNYLSKLIKGGVPTVVLENFPIANIIENLNRVKSMEVYI
ncbi:DUF3883 domain-containing protein [Bacillus cereus]|uniref:DUF3883 domain-containing protein n=1 Tax=Bacillus cereus TaxID=1396 RepID=A0AAW4QRP1_BACCE|nr:DUF3883 domain-containing protein [Bacillus cereus]MBY0037449.1 DUF3883 domain-containing protein [Bacillus cereus]